jgi:hypothetical protein
LREGFNYIHYYKLTHMIVYIDLINIIRSSKAVKEEFVGLDIKKMSRV